MLTAVLCATALSAPKWTSLFNGKNLDGWTPKIRGYELGDNFANTFRVKDRQIQVRYDGYGGKFDDRFGHLFYKKPFGNFRLRIEYRFVGDQLPDGPGWAWRNSGVMILGQDPKTMERDQSFPVSIEVQFLGSNEETKRPTGNLCTPGTNVVFDGKLLTRHVTDSNSAPMLGDQWVTVEVEFNKGTLRHVVNGKEVLTYKDPQLDPNDGDAKKLLGSDLILRNGTISLQSESHPIDFRKIEVMELP